MTNQTRSAQAVTFAADADAPGQTATTAPIDPSATGTLELDARPGEYAVSTADDAIERATVKIGAPRPSAQNVLSQPDPPVGSPQRAGRGERDAGAIPSSTRRRPAVPRQAVSPRGISGQLHRPGWQTMEQCPA